MSSSMILILMILKICKGYTPSLVDQLAFSREGHAKLPKLLGLSTVQMLYTDCSRFCSENVLSAWQQKVEVHLKHDKKFDKTQFSTIESCQAFLESEGTGGIPFLQHFNPDLEAVKDVVGVTSQLAKTFLGVGKVRLYQTSLFLKRAVDHPTPFHSDIPMTPFDTNSMITFWIPLNAGGVKAGGSGLQFVDRSHVDIALQFFKNNNNNKRKKRKKEEEDLSKRYANVSNHLPLQEGDATIHNGWLLHASGRENCGCERLALAITFVDADATVRVGFGKEESGNSGYGEDKRSFENWIGRAKEGSTPPLPVY